MAKRIEVYPIVSDTRAEVKLKKLKSLGFKVNAVAVEDVYTIDKDLTPEQFKRVGESLVNPVIQDFRVKPGNDREQVSRFNYAVEIGFLPGVTDNIGNTTREIIEDLLKVKFSSGEAVYSSQLLLLKGVLSTKEIANLVNSLINPLIQRAHVKTHRQFLKDFGMDVIVPKVVLKSEPKAKEVDLNVSDTELEEVGRKGVMGDDGTRRGPLALEPIYMKTIQAHFKKLGRNPTDVELESLSQTWSEHCKHTIFANPLDEIKDGLYKTYIKAATAEIRKKKGKKDICVSVFIDNSGAIEFDKGYLITHKVETHNSPSSLDPFGGAITGVVGVNRDALGFGLGAKPIANVYGFCFADPDDKSEFFRDAGLTDKLLPARRIMDGVIEGINTGGNQSGIPTPQGFLYFDNRYRGKPLVFCGTVGLIPKKIQDRQSHIKKAKNGDYIVMIGGRVGIDGVHGATLASEALTLGSPSSAVQIGDPITQKKLSDVLIREARDLNLYSSITDCGGGGLSSSVGEMAKESGGCRVYLDKVPLKYPGLDPWQIWISESQERMILAIPKAKFKRFKKLMESRGVETTIIGEFTASDKCQLFYKNKLVMDLDMEFLHNGLPKINQKSTYVQSKSKSPKIIRKSDYSQDLLDLLSRKSLASFEFISSQYDHDVQGGSVLKPLIGKGLVNSEASVIKPLFESEKGIALSQGIYPSYSEIDPQAAAAAAIDTAIRNVIVVGANPEKIALLDNFCWCSSNELQRLGELKIATKACFDTALDYQTPFISGKDSMFNDFRGYDSKGNLIKVSVPPTLLISSIGVVEDITQVVSFDLKMSGDLVYILGETFDEMGGSEYFRYLAGDDLKRIGGIAPQVRTKINTQLYQRLHLAIAKGLVSASVAITRGGLSVAVAKMAMAGKLGVEISLEKLPGKQDRDDIALFSESQGRAVVTINPENKKQFESLMKAVQFKLIGKVTQRDILVRDSKNKPLINISINEALKDYKKTFKDY